MFGGGRTLSLDSFCWLGKDECYYKAQTATRFFRQGRYKRLRSWSLAEPTPSCSGERGPAGAGGGDPTGATSRTTHTSALTLLQTNQHFHRVRSSLRVFICPWISEVCGSIFLPVWTLISLYTNWFEPQKDDRLYLSALWVTADDSRQIYITTRYRMLSWAVRRKPL